MGGGVGDRAEGGGGWRGDGETDPVVDATVHSEADWLGLCEARHIVVSRAREATPVRERVTAEYQLSQPCLSRLPSPRSSASSRSSTEWTRPVLQTLKNYVIDST